MNGTTIIDEGLNPCSARMDKHTYGCPMLNISIHGKRLLRVGVCGVYLDLYGSGWRHILYARIGNGAVLFFPCGCIEWPMPDLFLKK